MKLKLQSLIRDPLQLQESQILVRAAPFILYCCCRHGGCFSVEPQVSHPANKRKIPQKLGLTKRKTFFWWGGGGFNLRVMLLIAECTEFMRQTFKARGY